MTTFRLLLSVFGVIVVAELPDKSALAALVLATEYYSPIRSAEMRRIRPFPSPFAKMGLHVAHEDELSRGIDVAACLIVLLARLVC